MAEIDQTATKSENAKNNGAIIAEKLSNAMENLPCNEEVLHGLNKVKVELDRAKTAPEIDNTGRRLLQDAELLVDDMKILVKERNEGDRMQELARELKFASEMIARHSQELGKTGKVGAEQMNTKGLNKAAREGFKSVQMAVMEIVRSSEFRSDLMDFLRFAADVFRQGVKDSRKDRVAMSKKERKMQRLEESYASQRRGSDHFHTDCAECNASMGSSHTSAGPGVPDRVTNVKDNAEIAINEQLSNLNLPHRVELSDEQLDELVNRFIDIMRSIANRPRTREAFMGIMNLVQLFTWELNHNSGKLRKQTKKTASNIQDDDHVRNVIFLAREQIEQFTGGKSVKPFFRHFKQVARILRNDQETRAYFDDLWAFIERIIENPKYLDARETTDEARLLIKRSRNLKNQEVSDHLYDALQEGRRLIKKITEDPVLNRMRNDFTRLIDDITKDSYGNYKMDGDVWNQIRLILTYCVVERVRIPLPPIESEDEKRQVRVKDVVLNLRDFVPAKVTLEDHARMQFDVADLRHPRMRKTRNIFSLYLKDIHFSVHDVDIWFRRKRAPHMETSLKADLDIGADGRRGLDLRIEVVSKPGSPGMFQVRRVNALINNLRIHVADTGMAFMYNAVLKMIKGRIARRLERSMEENLTKGLEQLNTVLVERIADPARRAAHAAGDKAGETDFQDLIRRFGETSLGRQAVRGMHMAKGDTAAGKRDRRHAKKHVKSGYKKGKVQAGAYKDKATERIADYNEEKFYGQQQQQQGSSINVVAPAQVTMVSSNPTIAAQPVAPMGTTTTTQTVYTETRSSDSGSQLYHGDCPKCSQ